MLLYFSISNWGMIQDCLSFSMIAQRQQAHSERLRTLKKFNKRVLPIAAVYGPNASGKSTMIDALKFAQAFVLLGLPNRSDRISRQFYRLDKSYKARPSEFDFIFEINGEVFEYQFSFDDEKVITEELKNISPDDENIIFSRDHQQLKEFNEPLKSSTNAAAYFEGCAPNKLYVTNLAGQGNRILEFVSAWFRNLLILKPNEIFASYSQYSNQQSFLSQTASSFFKRLGTGICGFISEEVTSGYPSIPEFIRENLQKNPNLEFPMYSPQGNFFVLRWDIEEAKPRVFQIRASHKSVDGSFVNFNLGAESDGSRRLMDLLPLFLGLHLGNRSNQPRVCFVDEMDRSLHPLLLKRILSDYLAVLDQNWSSQLIFTTHNAELIDQDILRRDEICFLERTEEGSCHLTKLSDFRDESGKAVRFDSLIRKRYLRGDFGGVPELPLSNLFELTDDERHTNG